MLNFKKKYDEGMVAGIRSFQKRVNEVSDSINSSYELVNERLDQFDKINDKLIDEMKRMQTRDVYGLIDENDYDLVLSQNIKVLICSYMIKCLENEPDFYQYTFFKGCCVKFNNFETINHVDYLAELADSCDVKEAEITIKIITMFISLASNNNEWIDFLDSELIDEFTISFRKIKSIKKYIDAMQEIYGKNLCYIYGKIDDDSFIELSNEYLLTDPEEMLQYGKQIIEEGKYGLKWIIKAASLNSKNALDYLKSNIISTDLIVGIKKNKIYYTNKCSPFTLMSMNDFGEIHKIYTFNKNNQDFILISNWICYKEFIAFGIQCGSNCYLFSLNTNTDSCNFIDEWVLTSMQVPYIKRDNFKIQYGYIELSIDSINNDLRQESYKIDFNGKNKEVIYD